MQIRGLKSNILTIVMTMLFVLASSAQELNDFSEVVCPDVKVLAQALLRAELAGNRLPGNEKNPCLKDKAELGKYFNIGGQIDEGDRPVQPIKLVNDPKSCRISKVTSNIKDMPEYFHQAEFVCPVIKGQTEVNETGSFKFVTYEGESKRIHGCGFFILVPSSYWLDKKCHDAWKISK
jgi:hypothetical protein